VENQPLQELLAQLRSGPNRELLTVPQLRALTDKTSAQLPVPAQARWESTDADGVPAQWISSPGAAAQGALLYLHGGAYIMGSATSHRALIARLAQAAGLRALAIDYRLAPEHPCPAAVHDAQAAYTWLSAQGVPPHQIALVGNSAGGGLALALLLALRKAGQPLPACAVLISPWLDLAHTGASMRSRAAEDPVLTPTFLERTAAMYVPRRAERTFPLASPLYGQLRGLPPLLVQVGTAEVLLDDATRLAERARASDVQVDLEVWPDMIHVWHRYAARLPEAQQAINQAGAFVRRHCRVEAARAAGAGD